MTKYNQQREEDEQEEEQAQERDTIASIICTFEDNNFIGKELIYKFHLSIPKLRQHLFSPK